MVKQAKPKYLTLTEVLRGSKPSRLSDRVKRRVRARRAASLENENFVREQEDWSFLAGKMVGGEG